MHADDKDYLSNTNKELEAFRQGRYYRVEADINLDAIYKNIINIKEIINPSTKIMVVVKAGAYGHGAVPVAKAIESIVDGYGIATVEEGMELRQAGISKNILILGYTSPMQIKDIVEFNITPTIFDFDTASGLSLEAIKQEKEVPIHIKIDTGMSRLGFPCKKNIIEEIIKISKLDGIKIEGIFSHFACADEVNKDSTYKQLEIFLQIVSLLEKEDIYIPIKHISNSAGIIDIPEGNLDLVRCGIATYGLYPSRDVNHQDVELIPAMTLKTHISFVKEVEQGVGVSYGSTYITNKKTKIATIPVGYGDGYPRKLSSRARVLIRGQSVPIIGRICMDQFMVDVSNLEEVKEGDTVTLVGRDQDECITVEELAGLSETINYEFICNLGRRIPRLYYSNNRLVEVKEYS